MTASQRRSLHVAAHKGDPRVREEPVRATADARARRSFNEATHKLGYWAPPAVSAHEAESEATRRRFEALADVDRDVIAHAGKTALALGALDPLTKGRLSNRFAWFVRFGGGAAR